MWSAMAFINSGGTLFPTRAPSAVANFPERRIWTTDSLKSPQVLLIQLLTRRERSVTGAFLRLIPAD